MYLNKLFKQYNLPISYKVFQPNPSALEPVVFGHNSFTSARRDDCSTRAMCAVTGEKYDSIFNQQIELAKKHRVSWNHIGIIEEVLSRYNFKRHLTKRIMTGYSFILTHPKGKYALELKDHIYGIVDGCVMDAFYSTDEPDKVESKIDRMLGEGVGAYYSQSSKED